MFWMRKKLVNYYYEKNQKIFEYRDKPGKVLAYVLDETPDVKVNIKMLNNARE